MDYAEFFEEVTDYRVQGRCLHELSDILLLVLCGLLADCETFEDIYDYACDKEATLREFMDLPAGIPSHDTLNRVFRHLMPTEDAHRAGTLPEPVGAGYRDLAGRSAPDYRREAAARHHACRQTAGPGPARQRLGRRAAPVPGADGGGNQAQ